MAQPPVCRGPPRQPYPSDEDAVGAAQAVIDAYKRGTAVRFVLQRDYEPPPITDAAHATPCMPSVLRTDLPDALPPPRHALPVLETRAQCPPPPLQPPLPLESRPERVAVVVEERKERKRTAFVQSIADGVAAEEEFDALAQAAGVRLVPLSAGGSNYASCLDLHHVDRVLWVPPAPAYDAQTAASYGYASAALRMCGTRAVGDATHCGTTHDPLLLAELVRAGWTTPPGRPVVHHPAIQLRQAHLRPSDEAADADAPPPPPPQRLCVVDIKALKAASRSDGGVSHAQNGYLTVEAYLKGSLYASSFDVLAVQVEDGRPAFGGRVAYLLLDRARLVEWTLHGGVDYRFQAASVQTATRGVAERKTAWSYGTKTYITHIHIASAWHVAGAGMLVGIKTKPPPLLPLPPTAEAGDEGGGGVAATAARAAAPRAAPPASSTAPTSPQPSS